MSDERRTEILNIILRRFVANVEDLFMIDNVTEEELRELEARNDIFFVEADQEVAVISPDCSEKMMSLKKAQFDKLYDHLKKHFVYDWIKVLDKEYPVANYEKTIKRLKELKKTNVIVKFSEFLQLNQDLYRFAYLVSPQD